jgi:hypothetical protein
MARRRDERDHLSPPSPKSARCLWDDRSTGVTRLIRNQDETGCQTHGGDQQVHDLFHQDTTDVSA